MNARFDAAFSEVERSPVMRTLAYLVATVWIVGSIATWLGVQTLNSLIR
jgi:hypothetical protein